MKVYFVHCKYLYDLMLSFSVCHHVNWTDQGMKILLCQYYKVGEFDDLDDAVKTLSKWDGNEVTSKIGRSVLRIGDIFEIDGCYYLFVCKRLIKIPEAISKRLLLND